MTSNPDAGRLALVLSEQSEVEQALAATLTDMDFRPYCLPLITKTLLKDVSEHQAALIILALEHPRVEVLESLRVLSIHQPTPILMFANSLDPGFIPQALKAGVCHYVGCNPLEHLLPSQIYSALAQFSLTRNLEVELVEARTALQERRLIDRAKYELMRVLKLDEQRAFEHLRKESMNSGTPLARIAQQVLDTVVN